MCRHGHPSLSLSGAGIHPSAIGCSALGGIRELGQEVGSDSLCTNGSAREDLPRQSPGVSTIFCGQEVRLKALPAAIWSEDWFTSPDFSLAQWTCSTCMRNATPREGCDLESTGCIETERRFAPPDVIKCGESFVACILKFIPCVLHPPVLASKAARVIKRSDQEGVDGIRLKSKPQWSSTANTNND